MENITLYLLVLFQQRYFGPFVRYYFKAYYSQRLKTEKVSCRTRTDSERYSFVLANAGEVHSSCTCRSANAEGNIDVTSGKVDLQRISGGEYHCHSYKLDAHTHRTRYPTKAFASERACPGQPRTCLNLNTVSHELFDLSMSLDSCQNLARHRSGSPLQVCRV